MLKNTFGKVKAFLKDPETQQVVVDVAKLAGVAVVANLAFIGAIVVGAVVIGSIEQHRDPEKFKQDYISELEESLAQAKA